MQTRVPFRSTARLLAELVGAVLLSLAVLLGLLGAVWAWWR